MIPPQAMMKDAISPHTPSPLSADADATVTGTDIVYLADLQPQPVEWRWQHRLAARTLAMLSGEPGSGKTWVALAIAAALTRGRDPFTGEKLKPATVLSASAEHLPPHAEFDIGVRSSKDGKSGVWWWTLPHPGDECPPVNEARCSN